VQKVDHLLDGLHAIEIRLEDRAVAERDLDVVDAGLLLDAFIAVERGERGRTGEREIAADRVEHDAEPQRARHAGSDADRAIGAQVRDGAEVEVEAERLDDRRQHLVERQVERQRVVGGVVIGVDRLGQSVDQLFEVIEVRRLRFLFGTKTEFLCARDL